MIGQDWDRREPSNEKVLSYSKTFQVTSIIRRSAKTSQITILSQGWVESIPKALLNRKTGVALLSSHER